MQRGLIVAILLIFLAGCSARFVYNWMDWIVPWEVDDYVDLSRDQTKALDQLIESTLAWHRVNELPQYVQHIDDLEAALEQPMTPERVQSQLDRFEEHWNRLYQHLVPDVIPALQDLTDEQVQQIIDTAQDEEDELRQEYQDLTIDERIEKSNKSMKKGMKKRIGRLSEQQQQLIEQFNDSRHRSLKEWFSYRDRYMQLLILGLTERADSEKLAQRLRLLLIDYDELKSLEHKKILDFNRQLLVVYLADMHSSLSNKQLKRLVEDLDSLREDFIYLQRAQ
ncbi:DUF6279 family lipoprotein [Ferrimonas lipolytica]|uniref:Lipoprotein n=1 Tax=Ferrimonas lipolytica TaxID=2724191 RepID=A0A6H1UEB3_9GAMM|nr:DUF6279 family lipoprotein [Ferrimonas lipolytica]QIZ76132.1 hypothetical protein HER31_04030 [Ferrimonas lipolytica]